MGFTCCVPGCYKKAAIRFPQNPTLRKEWVSNINRLEAGSKYKLFSPDDKKHRICSDHFEGGLKTDSNNVPTLFPGRVVTVRKRQTKTSTSANVSHPRPRKPSSETAKQQRTIGVKNRRGRPTHAPSRNKQGAPVTQGTSTPDDISHNDDGPADVPDAPTADNVDFEMHRPQATKRRLIAVTPGVCAPSASIEVELSQTPNIANRADDLTSLHLSSEKYSAAVTQDHTYSHPAVQPITPKKQKLMHNLSSASSNLFTLRQALSKARYETKLLRTRVLDIDTIIGDSSTLNLYTGFRKRQHFEALLGFLKPDERHIIYPTSTGPGFRNHLTFENSVLLTLTKYKLDSPQDDLAFRFGVPQSDVSRIITAFTDLIYRRFREIQIWPSQKLVRENLPECFKEKYANTRVVIDCTEIFIQRPSSATVQQLTYSSYKSHNTAKALIGVSPNGFISFLPDIQPGRLSDKELVIRSGLVDMLEPGDLVMADRGFTIEDLLSGSVELNIPPFLHDKSQFDASEVAATRSIASVRIHVERVIGRVRRYSILSSTFPNNSLAQLNKIWVNCCYLTNLQYPSFL